MRYVLECKSGTLDHVVEICEAQGIRILRRWDLCSCLGLEITEGDEERGVLEEIAGDECIVNMGPEEPVRGVGLPVPTTAASYARMNAAGPHRYGNQGQGIDIAVLDSGARLTHQDLRNIVFEENYITNGATPAADDWGHGTNVQGILTQIAPRARFHVLKVLDNVGNGSSFDIIDAVNYCAANNIDVSNSSFAGTSGSPPAGVAPAYAAAIAAGCTCVAAVGNSGPGASTVRWPASIANVIGVGAIRSDDSIWPSSSRGVNVDLVAPGVSIQAAGFGADDQVSIWTGTSQASPAVAGAVALAKAAGQADSTVVSNADSLGTPTTDFGAGAVDVTYLETGAFSTPGDALRMFVPAAIADVVPAGQSITFDPGDGSPTVEQTGDALVHVYENDGVYAPLISYVDAEGVTQVRGMGAAPAQDAEDPGGLPDVGSFDDAG